MVSWKVTLACFSLRSRFVKGSKAQIACYTVSIDGDFYWFQMRSANDSAFPKCALWDNHICVRSVSFQGIVNSRCPGLTSGTLTSTKISECMRVRGVQLSCGSWRLWCILNT